MTLFHHQSSLMQEPQKMDGLSTNNRDPLQYWLTTLTRSSSEGDLSSLREAVTHLFTPALYAVVENGQGAAIACLLDRGAVMSKGLFLLVTESNFHRILELFLERGLWDFNTPVDHLKPPALA
ncbi:MAG: hypothetical protein FRX48_01717 [Lasallia pustulata]|uniref:Uncharacterized protein n=1 Tax=Lasallia pustulata TaxID=136370 RepID=A0A5M8Q1W4_9LECA|nr:MAG: hypothetical protein FRX48_01717 [Lasallia pustulata]